MVLKTSVKSGYLYAQAKGRFALRTADDVFLTLVDEMVQNHADRVLFDGRNVTGVPRMIERYLHGGFVAAASKRLPKDSEPKFAYVLNYPQLHPGRLGEKTARKRGMNVRAFDNMDDAMVWLFGAQA